MKAILQFQTVRSLVGLGVAATLGLRTQPGQAADTLEPFDLGRSDTELYAGTEGLGGSADAARAGIAGLIGYGLTPRLSLFLVPEASVDGELGAAQSGLSLGGFGTLLDSAHVDLDLGAAGGSDGEHGAVASFAELNLDRAPELSVAGVYARGGLSVFGTEHPGGRPAIELGAGATLGGYVTLAARHQLLLELDGALYEGRRERVVGELGRLRLGYNVALLEHAELITEVSLEPPGAAAPWTGGVLVGVIATIPGAASGAVVAPPRGRAR
jgi:hypothetical protein